MVVGGNFVYPFMWKASIQWEVRWVDSKESGSEWSNLQPRIVYQRILRCKGLDNKDAHKGHYEENLSKIAHES